MASTRLVIFNDSHGWHTQQLQHAFSHYDIDITTADLAQCYIDINNHNKVMIPGLAGDRPDIVIVRGIAPGSLEQITFRLDCLHYLAEQGVRVYNSAKAIEFCVDKARTSLKLAEAGIATPATWSCEQITIAQQIATQQFAKGQQLILKPLFGCQGKQLQRLQNMDELLSAPVSGQTFYLQQYIAPAKEKYWQDWRLFVINHQVYGAMRRQSSHWITNFAQGGHCQPCSISDDMAELAIQATRAVDADYAGVDLIQDQYGQFYVLEVNSMPAWKGLVAATQQDIATPLAANIMQQLHS